MNREDESREALRNSGVWPAYWDKALKFADFTKEESAERIKAWVASYQADDLMEEGLFLHGPKSMDCCQMVARSLIMKCGVPCAVRPFPAFAEDVRTGGLPDLLEDINALVIPGFFDSHFAKVLPEEEIYSIQWHITGMIKRQFTIVLGSTHEIDRATWWSEPFREVIRKHTLSVHVV